MNDYLRLHSGCLYDVAVTGTEVVVTETLDGATCVFHLTAPATLHHDTKRLWRVQPGPNTSFVRVADSYGFTIDTAGTECEPWGEYPEKGIWIGAAAD